MGDPGQHRRAFLLVAGQPLEHGVEALRDAADLRSSLAGEWRRIAAAADLGQTFLEHLQGAFDLQQQIEPCCADHGSDQPQREQGRVRWPVAQRRQFAAQPDRLEGRNQFDPHLGRVFCIDRCCRPQTWAEGHPPAELLAQGFEALLAAWIHLLGGRWNQGDLQIQSGQLTDQRGGITLQNQFTEAQVQSQFLAEPFDLQPLQSLTEQKLQDQNGKNPASAEQATPGPD